MCHEGGFALCATRSEPQLNDGVALFSMTCKLNLELTAATRFGITS